MQRRATNMLVSAIPKQSQNSIESIENYSRIWATSGAGAPQPPAQSAWTPPHGEPEPEPPVRAVVQQLRAQELP